MSSKKVITGILLYLLIAVVGSAVVFSFYGESNRERTITQNKNFSADMSALTLDTVERTFKNAKQMVFQQAMEYARDNMPETKEDKYLKLYYLNNNTNFTRVGYADPAGILYSSKYASTDISDREYFQSGLSGASGYTHIGESRITGKSAIAFYAPVKQNEIIQGIFLGFYEDDKMKELFSSDSYTHDMNCYMLESDGDVVIYSDGAPEVSNYFSLLEGFEYENDSEYEEINRFLNDPVLNHISFARETAEGPETITIRRFEGSDWFFVVSIPGHISSEMISEAEKSGYPLVIAILFALIVLLLFFIISDKKKKSVLNEQINKNSDELRYNLKKLSVANDDLSCMINNIGRDVKAPLGKMVFTTKQAVRSVNDKAFAKDCLDKIQKTSRQVLDMIAEREKDKGNLADLEIFCQITGTLKAAVKAVKPNMARRKQSIMMDSHGVRHDIVKCSRQKLQALFVNVLTCISDVSEKGEKIALLLKEENVGGEGISKYLLEVSNAGEGITPEYIKHLFMTGVPEEEDEEHGQNENNFERDTVELMTDVFGNSISIVPTEGNSSSLTVCMCFRYMEIKDRHEENEQESETA